MLTWLGDLAETISWWAAVGAFLLIAVIETARPERDLRYAVATRWAGHFALYGACLAVLGLAAPVSLAGKLFGGSQERFLFAALAREGGWTVLIGGLLLLDLLVYAQHRLQHRVFLLWRFHAVHHADADMDASTSLRHHPGEVLTNACLITFLAIALGAPAWLFPVYGVISLSSGLFQHMNCRLPAGLECRLEWLLVTPAMHSLHHSVQAEHFDTNYGTVLSIWDRLFGTYRHLSDREREVLRFGVPGHTSALHARADFAWVLPFALRREPTGQPVREVSGV